MKPQLIRATTAHRRLGEIENRFRYSVDYVLFDPDRVEACPALFSRNRANIMAIHDRDHGGRRNNGEGSAWVRKVLQEFMPDWPDDWKILLLAQPRLFGTGFTPVSFWFILDRQDRPRAVIAEVNNTFGDRHSYLCAHPGFAPIGAKDVLQAQKVFHVSPFQPVSGTYRFTFSLSEKAVSVRIDFRHEGGGLIASLTGPRQALTSRAIASVAFQRPLGALRVLALIHWQALKLWWRKSGFHKRPLPPANEVSR